MMKLRAFLFGRALASCALCAASVGAVAAHASANPGQPLRQSQPNKGAPQASDAEQKAAQAVQSASDAQATAAAAMEFVKKYPKSSLRPQVARTVAGKLAAVSDPAQRVTLAEGALKVFDKPDDALVINPVLINAYVEAKRLDDAFRVATPAAVEKLDDPVGVMISLLLAGAEQARQKNPKYVQASQQLGLKAIEIVEGGKKPERVEDARWEEYRTEWLPQAYQALAVLALAGGNQADAQARLAKAAAAKSSDPNTYILIGALSNEEYQQTVQQHKAASGAAKDELLKKAHAQLDQVIDAWAHAVALTLGDARYDQTRTQLMQDLESYYKYRRGSTEGMQQLIDKYKKPAAVTP